MRNMKLDSSGEMGESECFPLKLLIFNKNTVWQVI